MKGIRGSTGRKHLVWTLLAAVLAVAALLFILHPRGTRSYLIMGMDNYGSLDELGRSDVMMLVRADFSHATVYVATFARDLMVENEFGRDVKINTLVRKQGEEALVDAVERNFALEIDGWFRVNFSGVIEIVDALGGAEVELTQEEARYIDRTAGVYAENPLGEGPCRLNGAQALCYARCRHLDNDFGRGARQSKLAEGLVAQTKKLTLAKLASLFGSLDHAWRSSLSGKQQLALFLRALWLRGARVVRIGVPFEGTYRYGSAGVTANMPKNLELLHEALGMVDATVPQASGASGR